MIQFNLLPDIKLEYIRAKRMKRIVITTSFALVAVSLVILGILASFVFFGQKGHIDNLTEDIARTESDINEIPQVDRMLTVQNQLNTINGLHADKPVSSRFFTYIERLTPADISINSVELSFDDNTMVITGEADSLATVNKFVDTFKFTEYIVRDDDEDFEEVELIDNEDTAEVNPVNAFSSVVLDTFNRENNQASYSIELEYDPVIFDSDKNVQLLIQERITTRSQIERPDALFREPELEEGI